MLQQERPMELHAVTLLLGIQTHLLFAGLRHRVHRISYIKKTKQHVFKTVFPGFFGLKGGCASSRLDHGLKVELFPR